MKILFSIIGILVLGIVISIYCSLRAGAKADEHMDDLN